MLPGGDAIIAPAATRRLLDRFLAAPQWADPAADPATGLRRA